MTPFGTIVVMNIAVLPGKYVVAVSGGVDSMVLLDMLRNLSGVQLVVAHFDHGIRADSAQDRELVEQVAARYGLPFVYETAKLGAGASEAVARTARYAFLQRVMSEHQARAIITAHHQDDMLETAILNILRGTGRKGLSALGSSAVRIRPLLDWPKEAIVAYAHEHHIIWHEDSTNADEQYLRNYIRRNIMTRLTTLGRAALLGHVHAARRINEELDTLLHADLDRQTAHDEMNRRWFTQLPYAVAAEMMAMYLRRNNVASFDRRTIDRLVVAAKTAHPGKRADAGGGLVLYIGKETIQIAHFASK
jgi:tRNA(Ile)-lysidine synthetase-like protein